MAVAVVDLPRDQGLAGFAQFVAAAEQAYAQRPIDFYPRDTGRGQQADFLGAQALPGTDQCGATA